MDNYVVCLKHGTKYSADYVNILHNMVKRNTSIDYKFVCFTENTHGLNKDIEVVDLPEIKVAGWWYKPMFFNPKLPVKGKILYFDLDVVIFNNIDRLFTYEPDKFCIIRDFNRHVRPDWDKMNSSCFRLDTGSQAQVYNNFRKNTKEVTAKFFGDQDWIYNQVKEDFAFWPDEWIQSYKWEMRGKPPMTRINGVRNFITPGEPEVLPDTSVAVFHGEPNPAQCVDDWVKKNWK